MDPVSALSLVANIFGVISFAKDVVDVARQIRNSGDSNRFLHLEGVAMQLQSAVANLNLGPSLSGPDPTPAQEDAGIVQVTRNIKLISDKITNLLNEVREGHGRSWPSKLQTVLRTFKTIWNQNVTDELSKEVSSVQQSLQLHAIISIRTKLDKHAMRLEDAMRVLDDRTKELLPSFLTNFGELDTKCDDILANQHRSEELATSRHLEVLYTIRGSSPQPSNPDSTTKNDLSDEAEETILISLWFPFMQDREEMIHDPHKQTFDWIFRDPVETGEPWDDIGKFLQSGSFGTYWISGKAGSGKSTLMKYISNNATTKDLLLRWVGQNELVMLSFYFYHRGSDLQKSEVGVLRSLLYQILATRRGLIQLAFPERFRTFCIPGAQREKFDPSPTELKRAFSAVVQRCSDVNFFLAVDGLDEYHGADADMSLLVSTFRDLTKHSTVKGLFSSRPWSVFQQSFAGCPQLRLHDLTRPDIASFVAAKVGQHPRVQIMAAMHSRGVENLMTEIVDASCGVFLWVYLVVHSVLEGLTNYDTVEEIRARVRELPTDLEQLYRRLWSRIPKHYRAQAARILLLVEAGTLKELRLSLLSLSFAEMDDPKHIIAAPVMPLKNNDVKNRLDTMRAWLLSRCMGFVEIQSAAHDALGMESFQADVLLNNAESRVKAAFEPAVFHDLYPNNTEKGYQYPQVAFLHRTVNEFILSGDIRRDIIRAAAAPGGDFSPETGLLHSALMRIKTFNLEYSRDSWLGLFHPWLEGFIRRFFLFARLVEHKVKRPATKVLHELDRAMLHLQRKLLSPSSPPLTHWAGALRYSPPRAVKFNGSGRSQGDDSLLSLCVYYDLVLFVKEYIAEAGSACVSPENGASLLGYAFPSHHHCLLDASSLDMIHLLLESGATPNDYGSCGTVWHNFITCGWTTNNAFKFFKLVLLHGANLTAEVTSRLPPSKYPNHHNLALTGLQTARLVCEYGKRDLRENDSSPLEIAQRIALVDEVTDILDELEAKQKTQSAAHRIPDGSALESERQLGTMAQQVTNELRDDSDGNRLQQQVLGHANLNHRHHHEVNTTDGADQAHPDVQEPEVSKEQTQPKSDLTETSHLSAEVPESLVQPPPEQPRLDAAPGTPCESPQATGGKEQDTQHQLPVRQESDGVVHAPQHDQDVDDCSIAGQETQDKNHGKGGDIVETHEQKTMDQMAVEENGERRTTRVRGTARRSSTRVFFCCFARRQR